jgi:hypothetical protein
MQNLYRALHSEFFVLALCTQAAIAQDPAPPSTVAPSHTTDWFAAVILVIILFGLLHRHHQSRKIG